jgi:hypothetical protein
MTDRVLAQTCIVGQRKRLMRGLVEILADERNGHRSAARSEVISFAFFRVPIRTQNVCLSVIAVYFTLSIFNQKLYIYVL